MEEEKRRRGKEEKRKRGREREGMERGFVIVCIYLCCMDVPWYGVGVGV